VPRARRPPIVPSVTIPSAVRSRLGSRAATALSRSVPSIRARPVTIEWSSAAALMMAPTEVPTTISTTC
jgi:hypothetical protein